MSQILWSNDQFKSPIETLQEVIWEQSCLFQKLVFWWEKNSDGVSKSLFSLGLFPMGVGNVAYANWCMCRRGNDTSRRHHRPMKNRHWFRYSRMLLHHPWFCTITYLEKWKNEWDGQRGLEGIINIVEYPKEPIAWMKLLLLIDFYEHYIEM